MLATGLVMFTLLVNGTTLRGVIRLLGLDRLSPIDRLLRDRVLELSFAETGDMIAKTAQEHDLHPEAVERALAPYKARQAAAGFREAVEEIALTEHDRMTVALVALGNQERMLVLDTLARARRFPRRPAGADAQRRRAGRGRKKRRAARLQARRRGRARLPVLV